VRAGKGLISARVKKNPKRASSIYWKQGS